MGEFGRIIDYKDIISYDKLTGIIRFEGVKHYFSLSVVRDIYIYEGYLCIEVKSPKGFVCHKSKLPKNTRYADLVVLNDVIQDIKSCIGEIVKLDTNECVDFDAILKQSTNSVIDYLLLILLFLLVMFLLFGSLLCGVFEWVI